MMALSKHPSPSAAMDIVVLGNALL